MTTGKFQGTTCWLVVLCGIGSLSSAQTNPPGFGPNLLSNPGFEQLASNGKPVGWYDNGFTVDHTVRRSGAVSLRLRDAHTIPYNQSAGAELNLTKGTYFIGGWVRTDRLAATQGSGVRICLRAPPTYPWAIAVGCTAIIQGTGDWRYLSKSGIVVSQDTRAAVVLEAHAEPDGTAWFDDIELRLAQTDTTPPVISGIAVGGLSGTGATITWRTDEPADRQVEYGTTTSYGSQTPLNTTLSTSHQVTLSGLRPATTYHFRVRSRDAAGNLAVSANQTFTTLDTIPPVISEITVTGVSGAGATITWRTDEPADRQVEYGTTTSYGSQTPLETTLSTSHQVTLSGLKPATTYHFRVKSRDAAGNLAVSSNHTFTTLDTIPPVISALVVSSVSTTTATITWVTDEPADTQLDYGTTTAYGSQSLLDSRLLLNHSVTLTGLLPGVTYHCRARSRDAAGNLALSANLVFQTAAASSTPALKTGGLTAFPLGQLGPNLLTNGSFETPGAGGKPLGWSDNGFVMDGSVARTGNASYRLTNAHLIPYSQSASQVLSLKKGVYQISIWVKLNNLAAAQGGGMHVCFSAPPGYPWELVRTCTPLIQGTADWRQLSLTKIVLPQDTTAALSLEAYGEPDGTAWFDDAEVRREELPLSVFMLYPNYRGILFDDQSQVARFEVSVDPPGGAPLSGYQVSGTLSDELTGQILRQASYPAQATFTAPFDMNGLMNDRTYLARFRLLASSGSVVFDYPAFRIAKASGSLRQQMTVSFDEHNRILLRGRPTFLLGVYDAGLPYYSYESGWENLFNTERRLFELPINLYLNYWYGESGNAAWIPMLNVLQQRGIYALTNANCFSAAPVDQMTPNSWFLKASEADIETRVSHPAFLGFYAADECTGDLASNVFSHYQRMKSVDRDGLVLGTLLGDSQLVLWPEAVDLLATDPYPLYGAEPPGGYNFGLVADWTRRTRAAVRSSRPIASVLQFFQFTSLGRWPTRNELRNMSYMAIAEGANGLLYWSLGASALAWVCSDWCAEKVEYFNRLKPVLQELKALEPALAALDRPDLLVTNSNPAIRTRVKHADGKAYVIAYNSSAAPTTATFGMSFVPATVSVHGESRNIMPSGASFSDSFGPWEAHVYVVSQR